MAKRRKRIVEVPGLKQPRAKAAKDQTVKAGIDLEKDSAGNKITGREGRLRLCQTNLNRHAKGTSLKRSGR